MFCKKYNLNDSRREKGYRAGNLPELKYNETASYNLTVSVRQKHSYSSNNEILKKI